MSVRFATWKRSTKAWQIKRPSGLSTRAAYRRRNSSYTPIVRSSWSLWYG
jgi:hypothetical protein